MGATRRGRVFAPPFLGCAHTSRRVALPATAMPLDMYLRRVLDVLDVRNWESSPASEGSSRVRRSSSRCSQLKTRPASRTTAVSRPSRTRGAW